MCASLRSTHAFSRLTLQRHRAHFDHTISRLSPACRGGTNNRRQQRNSKSIQAHRSAVRILHCKHHCCRRCRGKGGAVEHSAPAGVVPLVKMRFKLAITVFGQFSVNKAIEQSGVSVGMAVLKSITARKIYQVYSKKFEAFDKQLP